MDVFLIINYNSWALTMQKEQLPNSSEGKDKQLCLYYELCCHVGLEASPVP
jgi:hypothetical protein